MNLIFGNEAFSKPCFNLIIFLFGRRLVVQVLGRTLVWNEEERCYYFVPVGKAPRKTEKQRRMSRHYFVNRKVLSQKWSKDLQEIMEKQYPILVAEYGEPVLDPPAREGVHERAPFLAIPYDCFRKGVGQVAKVNSTLTRCAVEAHLVQDPAVSAKAVQQRSLQLFVGHEPGVSLKHYHKKSSKVISEKLQKVISEAEKKEKDKKDKKRKQDKK